MFFVLLFFLAVFCFIVFIHFKIERFSPLIYPYIFWILYELPKIDFTKPFTSSTSNYYYLLITIGASFYFFGILYDRIIITKPLFKGLIVFKDFKVFQKYSKYLYYFSLLYFGYFFVFVAEFNFLFFFSRRLGNEDVQELVSANYFFVLLLNISILFQVISLIGSYSIYKVLKFLTLLTIVFLFTGSRGYILLPLMFLVIYIFSKKGVLKVAPIVFLAYFSFAILGALRSFDDKNSISTKNVISSSEKFSINDYQMQNRDVLALNYYEHKSLFYGTSYLAIFTSFIPRKVLGSFKPEMLDGKIGREVFKNYNAGFPLHPVTEGILNFGVLGLIILFLIGILFSNFIKSANGLLEFYIFSYLIIFCQTGYSTYCLYAFQYSLCVFFISVLARLKFKI